MVGNILCDHSSGTNEGIAADGVAADDRAVGAQGGAALDERGADLVHLSNFGAGVEDVGENHRRATEDAVFQGDTLVDGNVVLDLAASADEGVGADDDVLADVAVLADSGAGEDVGEVPDFGAFADLNFFIHNCSWMNEDVVMR